MGDFLEKFLQKFDYQKEGKQEDGSAIDRGFKGPEIEPEMRAMLFERWFDIAFDADKQMLTLSVISLGFLVTLIASKRVESENQLALLWIALGSLALAILLLILMLHLDKRLISVILEENKQVHNSFQEGVGYLSRIVFYVGIICSLVFFVSAASIGKKEEGNRHERSPVHRFYGECTYIANQKKCSFGGASWDNWSPYAKTEFFESFGEERSGRKAE